MQVFKSFFKIVRSYKSGIILYAAITMLMAILVSSQYDKSETTAYSNIKLSVLVRDYDNSELSKKVVDYLKSQHDVHFDDYEDDMIKDLIFGEYYTAYIEIPKGFMDSHLSDNKKNISILYDSNKAYGNFVALELGSFVDGVARFENAGFTLSEAVKNTNNAIDTDKFVVADNDDEGNTNSKEYSLFLFLPYAIMSIVLWCLLPAVLRFNGKDIKDRTMVSRLSPLKRNVCLFLGSTVVSMIVYLGVIVVTGVFIGSSFFSGKCLLSALNLLIFTFVTGTLLIFIASFPSEGVLKSRDVLVNIIGLSFSFLGGIFVPLEMLGDSIKSVGRFLPTYWYAVALRRIEDGGELDTVFQCFGMELIFGVFCLALGLAISRVTIYLSKS